MMFAAGNVMWKLCAVAYLWSLGSVVVSAKTPEVWTLAGSLPKRNSRTAKIACLSAGMFDLFLFSRVLFVLCFL